MRVISAFSVRAFCTLCSRLSDDSSSTDTDCRHGMALKYAFVRDSLLACLRHYARNYQMMPDGHVADMDLTYAITYYAHTFLAYLIR